MIVVVSVSNDLIFDFMKDLAINQERSARTIDGYAIDLTVFFRFLKAHFDPLRPYDQVDTLPFDDVDLQMLGRVSQETLKDYLRFLKEVRGNKDVTARRKLTSVSEFFEYLQNAYLVDENPALSLKAPKLVAGEPAYLSLYEAKRLLASIDGIHRERDYAIIMVFLTCGLKLSEVCDLKRSDYENNALRIVGPGGKTRFVHVNTVCRDALSDYLVIRETITSFDGAYLFLSARKSGLKRRSVHQLVQKHIKAAGLNPALYSAQSLRHTCAMLLYHETSDIAAVQAVLGHSSASSSLMYVKTSSQKASAAIDAHPLNVLAD